MTRLRDTYLQNANWQDPEPPMRPKMLSRIGGMIFLAVAVVSVIASVVAWLGGRQWLT